MWRMEERHALALERERDGDLLGNRVRLGVFGERPEILAECRQPVAIGWSAQHDEFALVVEAGELPQEIADVGPDAEIMQPAGVDPYAHGVMISCLPHENCCGRHWVRGARGGRLLGGKWEHRV